jgi:hypothetical protein
MRHGLRVIEIEPSAGLAGALTGCAHPVLGHRHMRGGALTHLGLMKGDKHAELSCRGPVRYSSPGLSSHQCVSLGNVLALINTGVTVEVREHGTERDVTCYVLALLIAELAKKNYPLSLQILFTLIRDAQAIGDSTTANELTAAATGKPEETGDEDRGWEPSGVWDWEEGGPLDRRGRAR